MSGFVHKGEVCPEEQTTDDFVITTIYFDGQFWAALIEKRVEGNTYTGRYVFGAEPSNPQLLHWMLYEFAYIPLYLTAAPVRLKLKKTATRTPDSLCKSLDAFKSAQSIYLSERKTVRRREDRADKEARWVSKRERKKAKKRH